ncbi:OLC1v1005363C1, partial [Oldenlandia corymbosa var. corymbosa]
TWCLEPSVLWDQATKFFKNLYAGNSGPVGEYVIKGEFPRLKPRQMARMERPVEEEEIRKP